MNQPPPSDEKGKNPKTQSILLPMYPPPESTAWTGFSGDSASLITDAESGMPSLHVQLRTRQEERLTNWSFAPTVARPIVRTECIRKIRCKEYVTHPKGKAMKMPRSISVLPERSLE